jgi:histidine triad (HIT) family protein
MVGLLSRRFVFLGLSASTLLFNQRPVLTRAFVHTVVTPYLFGRKLPALPRQTFIKRTMSEVDAAKTAASTDPAVNPFAPTFFDKIVSKEIPAKVIYEDDLCLAFRDINPQGPVHFLVIPKDKNGLNRLSSAQEHHKELLGHLMFTAQKVAHQEGLVPGGFRCVVNDGPDGAQSVYHLHIHVIGGRQMSWPPG